VRILDKYLLREFVWPLLYCFDAFAMLWIVMDLFENLGGFLKAHARVGQVLHYYLIAFPEAFVLIMPISLLLGLLFCLTNLGKNNELIAMRSSGVSLTRLAAPLLTIGFAASLLVFGVNELFVPRSKERADAFMAALQGKGRQDIVENFFFTNASARREWYARRFNIQTYEMQDLVQVYERKSDGTEFRVDAASARWVDGEWHFYDARIDGGVPVAATNLPAINDPPKRLAVEGKKPDQMTSAELRRYVRAQKRAGRTSQLAGYEVTLHSRYAFPLTCFMAVWIGLPLGLRVSRSGPLRSVGMALLLFVAFWFCVSFTRALGRGGQIPPALAAWLANMIFGAVGAVLLLRAR
jgi:lipopolysaccharide export system permease protein